MNDPKSYQKVNNMPRKDVNEILQQSPIKWKEKNARIMDIGCGDGSVTMEIWQKFMPKNFLELVGCDINENNIIFAQEHYGSENVKFIWLDIQGGVPDELKGRVAFTNVYDMLAEGGNCLIIFLGRNTVYEIYDRLSRQLKWNEDLTHVRTKFLSPYFDSKLKTELANVVSTIGVTVPCAKDDSITSNEFSGKPLCWNACRRRCLQPGFPACTCKLFIADPEHAGSSSPDGVPVDVVLRAVQASSVGMMVELDVVVRLDPSSSTVYMHEADHSSFPVGVLAL
ncbi:hypothetical protein MSG28_002962 [Choristoneura fumiferana]|uniref:Uncharacterized protein n=1 Tax=Choristoneura fumiferana TaxID=7141 RepID=A0ACC0JK12_CHOFU|nr:hypothetical protein MSG28_002962 [Choristoneura fumiferana]